MFGLIISNTGLIALNFRNLVLEGLLITGNIAITVFDLIKITGLVQDLTKPGLTACIVCNCDRTCGSIRFIARCFTCRSAVYSCKSKTIIAGGNINITSDQLLESTEFYFPLIRLIFDANSCRRYENIFLRVRYLAISTISKPYPYCVVNQLISGRS